MELPEGRVGGERLEAEEDDEGGEAVGAGAEVAGGFSGVLVVGVSGFGGRAALVFGEVEGVVVDEFDVAVVLDDDVGVLEVVMGDGVGFEGLGGAQDAGCEGAELAGAVKELRYFGVEAEAVDPFHGDDGEFAAGYEDAFLVEEERGEAGEIAVLEGVVEEAVVELFAVGRCGEAAEGPGGLVGLELVDGGEVAGPDEGLAALVAGDDWVGELRDLEG